MRRRSPIALAGLVVVGALAGCSGGGGRSDAAEGGPALPPAVVPEERSTCEALARVDLAVVSDEPGDLARSGEALRAAATRAPAVIAPRLTSLGAAYDRAAEDPSAVANIAVAPDRGPVLAWFATRCPDSR